MHLHDPRKPHEEQAVHAERCESGTKHTPQQDDAQLDAPFITLRPPAASVAGAHEVVGECVPDCIPPLIFSGAFLVSAKPCGTHYAGTVTGVHVPDLCRVTSTVLWTDLHTRCTRSGNALLPSLPAKKDHSGSLWGTHNLPFVGTHASRACDKTLGTCLRIEGIARSQTPLKVAI
jgi:hypothetical protein